MRSEHPERVGKSPVELTTGQPHPHWLELLGFERFRSKPAQRRALTLEYNHSLQPSQGGLPLLDLLPKIG